MVDRISKTLSKLSDKDRTAVVRAMRRIERGDISSMDIKKLRGGSHLYRARKGKLRIIYEVIGKEYKLLDVNLRSDTTYKRY